MKIITKNTYSLNPYIGFKRKKINDTLIKNKKHIRSFLFIMVCFSFLTCGIFQGEKKSNFSHLITGVHSEEFQNLLKVTAIAPLLEARIANQGNVNYIKTLNGYLQRFWVRNAGVERWKLPDDEAFLREYEKKIKEEYKRNNLTEIPKIASNQELIRAIKKTKIWDEVSPEKENSFDAALVLGASFYSFKMRLEYLLKLIRERDIKLKTIYFLSGDRPLDVAIEKKIMEEMDLAGIKDKTENTMMRYVFEKTFPETLKRNYNIVFINTPDQEIGFNKFRRANTKDTLVEFLKKASPEEKHLLIISNAPFIAYQGEIVRNTLVNGYISFLTGPSFEKKEVKELSSYKGNEKFLSVALDSIARVIYMMNENDVYSYPN